MQLALWLLLLGMTVHQSDQTRQSEEPKHAPTVEVCRADAAVWWSDDVVAEYNKSEEQLASGGKYIPNPAGDLSLKEVSARRREMYDCVQVDKRDAQIYRGAYEFYWGVRMGRYERFIERHGLMDEFLKEDAQGLR